MKRNQTERGRETAQCPRRDPFADGLRRRGERLFSGRSQPDRQRHCRDDRDAVQGARHHRRAANAEPLDQRRFPGHRAHHRAQGVPAVQTAEHGAEVGVACQQDLDQHRKRRPHGRRGQQQEQKADAETERVQDQWLIEEWPEDGREPRARRW